MYNNYGFIRVGAAVPKIRVADCKYNAEEILKLIKKSVDLGVSIMAFPELSITGYTCADLFQQKVLLDDALSSLKYILESTREYSNIYILGMPLVIGHKLYNCAVVIQKGKIIGIVPKSYIPNYKEFYEKRWFTEARQLKTEQINVLGMNVFCGADLVFQAKDNEEISFSVEICEDLWRPIPPSSIHSLNGAVLIFNLSASNDIIGKHEYRELLVKSQSGRCVSGYIYVSSGTGESSTDLVFGGDVFIAENALVLAHSKRFTDEPQIVYTEIDLQRLIFERIQTGMARPENISKARVVLFDSLAETGQALDVFFSREIDPHPFVPSSFRLRDIRCEEIFSIQTSALAKRYRHTGLKKAVIGVSGGLDSTLALLVTVKTFDILNIPRKNIKAVTMPGFGTTDETYKNAVDLMDSMGVNILEIDIKDACIQHFKDIRHDLSVHDITYENVQARERTQILMDIANKTEALVIGTGDLSEFALGWCTYNGDHMSMYAVNSSIPKTLVKYLVKWVADNVVKQEIKEVLYKIINTPITPELLPPLQDGKIRQKTEDIVGPYELHDFFLYHMLRYGAEPGKIIFLAQKAFQTKYADSEIRKWLKVFYKRFFSQQFKRSCLPDGPKVGTISLSPRGDWRMPSDAAAESWIKKV